MDGLVHGNSLSKMDDLLYPHDLGNHSITQYDPLLFSLCFEVNPMPHSC